jgi:hypothetical protein
MSSSSSSEDRVAPATWLNGLDTGCILKDRYELREVRGAGGFATVYRAKDTAFTVLEVSVAVKLAHDRLTVKNRRRFEREANVAAQINHPNIVRVLDYGVLDGRPWFVMPLLTGHSLQLRRGGHWLEMSRLMLQLCSAVHAMHLGTSLSVPGLRTQVLHRDIKPLNCFVTEREHYEPHLTLLDLGLCKLPGVQRLTSVGAVVGTSAYMAPECIVGAVPSTIRSEIYALGVTFLELLTGELPDPAFRIRGLTDDTIQAPDPRALRSEIPAALAAIVMRAMAPQLSRRFPDVGAMTTAIAGVLGRVGVRRTPLEARRDGVAQVIPLHPAPHLALVSEATALRAETDPEPAAGPELPPAPIAVAGPVTPVTPEIASATPPIAACDSVQVAALAPGIAAIGQPQKPVRRWFIAAAVAACTIATVATVAVFARGPSSRETAPLQLPAPRSLAATEPATTRLSANSPATSPASPPAASPATAPPQGTTRPERRAARPRTHATRALADAAAIQAAIQASAEAAAPALRGCANAPNTLSAQLQVHQQRGTVLMVDGEAIDARDSWHSCVLRELGHVQYPPTSAPTKVRIRFSLR